MASIYDCVEVVLGFEQGGLAFVPTLPEFSTLNSVDHLSGYWIKVKTGCQATLEVTGSLVPITTPIDVTAGWNLVSYLPIDALPVTDALASLGSNLLVSQGFDGGTMTYLPGQDPFNTLSEMKSCFGYWVKVDVDDALVYPDGLGTSPAKPANKRTQNSFAAADKDTDVIKTTSWVNIYSASLTLNNKVVSSGALVTAHRENGMKIGQFSLSKDGHFGFMSVYADDPTTKGIEGATSGEEFYLQINSIETDQRFTWTNNGDVIEIGYLTAKVEPGNEIIPDSYSLKQNYPNPFNPSTTINLDLQKSGQATITIFNLLGEIVAVPFDGIAESGSNKVIWDGRDSYGNSVASGIYFYRLVADKYTESKKMTLMK